MTYDYFLAGRTRNRTQILDIAAKIRASGKTVYCFLDNEYTGNDFSVSPDVDPEVNMQQFEAVKDWRNDATFHEIFQTDMEGLCDSEKFIVVLPAGLSAHMEIGAAYGMGKICYSIGEFEKPESLYLMLDTCYKTVEEFLENEV